MTDPTPNDYRRFFSELLPPGAVVFDIGANIGDRTAIFLDAGAARVIAVEADPSLIPQLIDRYTSTNVVIVPAAVTSSEHAKELLGRLYLCDQGHVFNTLSTAFRDPKGCFAKHGHHWGRSVQVRLSTLDILQSSFGLPDFIKIDVEGYEDQVLAGYHPTKPPQLLSFEFHQDMLETLQQCLDQISRIYSRPKVNLTLRDRPAFHWPEWGYLQDLVTCIQTLPEDPPGWPQFGDIYVRS